MKRIQSKDVQTLTIRSGMVAGHLREKVPAGSPTLPRTCSRQVRRASVTASNPEECYSRVITAPFLDDVITRFSIQGMSIVPSVLIAKLRCI